MPATAPDVPEAEDGGAVRDDRDRVRDDRIFVRQLRLRWMSLQTLATPGC